MIKKLIVVFFLIILSAGCSSTNLAETNNETVDLPPIQTAVVGQQGIATVDPIFLDEDVKELQNPNLWETHNIIVLKKWNYNGRLALGGYDPQQIPEVTLTFNYATLGYVLTHISESHVSTLLCAREESDVEQPVIVTKKTLVSEIVGLCGDEPYMWYLVIITEHDLSSLVVAEIQEPRTYQMHNKVVLLYIGSRYEGGFVLDLSQYENGFPYIAQVKRNLETIVNLIPVEQLSKGSCFPYGQATEISIEQINKWEFLEKCGNSPDLWFIEFDSDQINQ